MDFDSKFGYRFINFNHVFGELEQRLVCKECGGSISFSETTIQGLGFKLRINCKCTNKEAQKPIESSPVIHGHSYDINRRIIFSMRLLGIGNNGIEKFCAFMCLPKSVTQKPYDAVVNAFKISADAAKSKSEKSC